MASKEQYIVHGASINEVIEALNFALARIAERLDSAETSLATGTGTTTVEVTAETVIAALSGASLPSIGTPVDDDKVLLQDTSESDELKFATFEQFGAAGATDESLVYFLSM